MKRHIYGILVIFLSLCLFTSGCTGGVKDRKVEKKYEIGLVVKTRNSEYWMSVISGIEKAAEDYNVSAVILSPDTEQVEERQEKMIYDLIDDGVDALAVSPINSYDCQGFVQYSRAKGVPVYAFDAEIENQDVPYIGIDNEKAGEDAAKSMVEQIGTEGSIGIISGDQRQAPHRKRVNGFLNYINENTSLKVEFQEGGYSNRRISVDKLHELLETNPGLLGIYTTSAVTAMGVIEAIGEQNLCIASVDAQSDALEEVKDGKLAVLVSQRGYDIGYETVKYITQALDGEEQAKEKIIKADIITKENVDFYENEVE